MYTMLMMMAMSSGGDTAAFGGHKGGCDGNVASCQGGGGFLGLRGHKGGCNGSSCTGTVVCAPASCTGVVVAAPSSCTGVVVAGCTGNSCDGGRVGFLARLCHKKSNSCCGSTVVAPANCCGGVVAPAGCTGGTVVPAPVTMPPAKEEKKTTT